MVSDKPYVWLLQSISLAVCLEGLVAEYQCPETCQCGSITNRPRIKQVQCSAPSLLSPELHDIPVLNTVKLTIICHGTEYAMLDCGLVSRFVYLEELAIGNCHISRITKNAFCGMSKLIVLSIRNADIGQDIHTTTASSVNRASAQNNSAVEMIQNLECNCSLDSVKSQDATQYGLDPTAFLQTPQLMWLDLSYNHLQPQDIAPHLFCPLKNLRVLDVTGNGFTALNLLGLGCGNDSLASLKMLYMGDFTPDIMQPMQASIPKLPDLQELVIQAGGLTGFTPGSFENITKLKHFDASSNFLSKIPELNKLSSLEYLSLANNQLKGRLWDKIKHLNKLTILNVSNNALTSVSVTPYAKNTKLISVDFSFNQLNKIPVIGHLSRIRLLNLSNNVITSIDHQPFQFPQDLFQLILHNNIIHTINASAFSNLDNLEKLDLSYNRISEMGEMINIQNLWYFNISNNRLQKIPKFSETNHILVLSAENNMIKDLENDALERLYNIMYLTLDKNNIQMVPRKAFQNCSMLKYINLAHNNISYLEYGAFSLEMANPTSLRSIDLSYNKIIDIKYIFRYLPALVQLHLQNNFVTKLDTTVFPTKIQWIDLSNNRIRTIGLGTFAGLRYLYFVDLHNNSLQEFESEAARVPQWSTVLGQPQIWLEGNNLLCSCANFWLHEMAHPLLSRKWLPLVADIKSLTCSEVVRNQSQTYNIASFGNSEYHCPVDGWLQGDPCSSLCKCFSYRILHSIGKDAFCNSRNLTSVPMFQESTVDTLLHVTRLHLDGNYLGEISVNQMPIGTTEIYLNNSNIVILYQKAFCDLEYLELLHLNDNKITQLGKSTFFNLPKLVKLFLQSNYITFIDPDAFIFVNKLDFFYLHDNNLRSVYFITQNASVIVSLAEMTSLTLAHNPWSCECNFTIAFQNWLVTYSDIVKDVGKIKCQHPNNISDIPNSVSPGIPIIKQDLQECYPQQLNIVHKQDTVPVVALATVACIVIVILTVALTVYNLREMIRVWLFTQYGLRVNKYKEDEKRFFDAFLSYSSKDNQDLIDEFISKLENKPNNYRLCVHYRDWPVGTSIAESVIASVETSKRTIILLSQNFVKSEWCSYEFKTAHQKLLRDKTNRVIIILLEKISAKLLDSDLKLYLKTNTYLEWSDPRFWSKLQYAMPIVTAERNVNYETGVQCIFNQINSAKDPTLYITS